MTYLFTKEGCGKCDWVKTNVDLENMKDVTVMSLNREDPEALALLAYYECVTLSEKKLPILISDSSEVITGAVNIKNYLKEHCS